jgi:hypothetical protein
VTVADDELLARLRAVEDKQEILSTLFRYTHGVDGRIDLREVFAQDATLTTYGPDGELLHESDGVDAIEARMQGRGQPPPFALAPVIELDGDRAIARSYFVALRQGSTGPIVFVYGRYADVFERRDGRWLLVQRTAHAEAAARAEA